MSYSPLTLKATTESELKGIKYLREFGGKDADGFFELYAISPNGASPGIEEYVGWVQIDKDGTVTFGHPG